MTDNGSVNTDKPETEPLKSTFGKMRRAQKSGMPINNDPLLL